MCRSRSKIYAKQQVKHLENMCTLLNFPFSIFPRHKIPQLPENHIVLRSNLLGIWFRNFGKLLWKPTLMVYRLWSDNILNSGGGLRRVVKRQFCKEANLNFNICIQIFFQMLCNGIVPLAIFQSARVVNRHALLRLAHGWLRRINVYSDSEWPNCSDAKLHFTFFITCLRLEGLCLPRHVELYQLDMDRRDGQRLYHFTQGFEKSAFYFSHRYSKYLLKFNILFSSSLACSILINSETRIQMAQNAVSRLVKFTLNYITEFTSIVCNCDPPCAGCNSQRCDTIVQAGLNLNTPINTRGYFKLIDFSTTLYFDTY
jgi:hypothetical protein